MRRTPRTSLSAKNPRAVVQAGSQVAIVFARHCFLGVKWRFRAHDGGDGGGVGPSPAAVTFYGADLFETLPGHKRMASKSFFTEEAIS